jgi:hypothetical protein
VIDAINKNNGKYSVTTVQGGTIVLSLNDGKVMLTDAMAELQQLSLLM